MGQAWQDADPTAAAKVPTGHAVHKVASVVLLYVPTGQEIGVVPEAGQYCPGTEEQLLTHAVAPVLVVVCPEGHAVQAADPVLAAKYPMPHAAHEVAPVAELYWPAGHDWHEAAPATELYEPTPQGVPEELPAGQ
jgi:hypothetical protein